jgi:pantoate--beta-alanine ligase
VIELREIPEVRKLVQAWHRENSSVGLVMTMGALHRGHLSLIELARASGCRVLATIFVNPLQFGPSEDYAVYPRSQTADTELLAAAGCDAVFLPSVETIFPRGELSPADSRTLATVRGVTGMMDGEVRPGHFTGVATIVLKMLNIAAPDVAFFGEKDYQQYEVLRAMAEDLCHPARMVACPTVREADGLAMSSRNAYLNAEQRAIAPVLYRVMREAARELRRDGARRAGAIQEAGTARLLALGFDKVDYLEFRDARLDLAGPGSDVGGLRLYGAAWLGITQLTDNLLVAQADADTADGG